MTILLGDLNLTTHDLGFQLIRGILQLHDSFLERIDKVKTIEEKTFFFFSISKEKFDPTVGNIQMTCDVPENPFVKPNPHHSQGERIDYILYRSRHGSSSLKLSFFILFCVLENVKCLESYPTLHRVVNHPENLHYSDHLAVFALLEIDETIERKNLKTFENIEIIDEETRELLRSACLIVEESVQRLQRERIYWSFAFLLLIFILFSFNGNFSSNGYFFSIFTLIKNSICLIGMSVSLWSICLGKPVERNALSSIQNAMRLRLRAAHFSY